MVQDGRYIHCILYWASWGWKAFNYYLPLQQAEAHLIGVHSSCTDSPWTFSKYPV